MNVIDDYVKHARELWQEGKAPTPQQPQVAMLAELVPEVGALAHLGELAQNLDGANRIGGADDYEAAWGDA